MNISQIVRLASYNAAAIKKAGTLAPFITLPELYAWANEGSRKLEHKLRTVQANYFERIMVSTDTATQKIMGIDYKPSDSMRMLNGVNTLTLPPDFQSLTYIKITTPGYEFTPLQKLSHNHHDFLDMLRDTTERSLGAAMFWDIIGDRTLIWVPRLNTPLDIELGYVARPKRLVSYTIGTCSVPDGSTAVTGAGTVWASGTPFDSAFLDLMIGTDTVAPIAEPSLVYDGGTLNRVASIETNTGLTLASAKVGVAAAGRLYELASVPAYPEDYHFNLSDYVTMKILSKAGDQSMNRALLNWPDNIADLLTTARDRQTEDPETIEDWEPDG